MCVGNQSRQDQFLAKAVAIHGDKYDYSKVVLVDSRTDVTIICKDHGEFRQRPGVHIRIKKDGSGYGCRQCGVARRPQKSLCKSCGKWAKYCATKGYLCDRCRIGRNAEAEIDRVIRETSMCQACGDFFKHRSKNKNKFCSVVCWPSPSDLNKTVGQVAQEREADRELKQLQVDVDRTVRDIKRSLEAKRRYKKTQSEIRYRKRYSGIFKSIRKLEAKRQNYELMQTSKGKWMYRIMSRLGGARGRTCIQQSNHPAPSSFAIIFRRYLRRVEYQNKDPWLVKFQNKFSGMRKRRRRKHENQKVKGRGSISEAEEVRFQMCFDWSTNKPR